MPDLPPPSWFAERADDFEQTTGQPVSDADPEVLEEYHARITHPSRAGEFGQGVASRGGVPAYGEVPSHEHEWKSLDYESAWNRGVERPDLPHELCKRPGCDEVRSRPTQ